MEVTNVVEFRELAPGEQLFAEGDESEVGVDNEDGHVARVQVGWRVFEVSRPRAKVLVANCTDMKHQMLLKTL